jgi:NAD(P)H-dependent FMN reductase
MQTLQIVTAATREARQGGAVAAWMIDQATQHGKFQIEPVDLAAVDLPLFDEPKHPRLAEYEHEHTNRWSAIVSRADAFVFVTPEYDFGPPASLVNALQHLVREWAYKPVGFVSYGGVSVGLRGVQITKQICSALKLVPMFEAVAIPFFAQHLDPVTKRFDPGELQAKAAAVMLDELARWAHALRPLRAPAASA